MSILTQFLISDFSVRYRDPMTYVELIFLILAIACAMLVLLKLLHREFAIYFYSFGFAIVLVSFLLGLSYLFLFSLGAIVICTVIFLFVNIGEIRPLVANSLTNKKKTQKKSLTNEADIYKNITTAVRWLSNSKTGAIITFERNTILDDFIKSGTTINCPITPEIIETIFYEGTRLHDGAMIIRENTIVAAAVFYPPSTRGLTGKYGARHRAALGISEITDSITVIVSEETGRVTLAYAGILEPVVIDEFERVLKDAMSSNPEVKTKHIETENK